MDLWSKITGMILLEITAAEPEQVLNRIAQENIPVWEVKRCSALVLQIQIPRSQWPQVKQIGEKAGATFRILRGYGLIFRMSAWKKRPVVLLTLLLLTALTIILPERILFVDVQGNDGVPERLILEVAEKNGGFFGANTRALRSEAIKNELLGELKALEWVGVNTVGCRALIQVRERKEEPEYHEGGYSSLVACTDGIIDQIVMNRGTLLCQTGQAVKQGELLVSGYTDLGICSRITDAQAEIYALTAREVEVMATEVLGIKQNQTGRKIRIALIFGNKRINLYSDSGILPSGCGKMTYKYPLRLPGGDCLPVVLVIEQIMCYDIKNIMRTQAQAEQLLLETAKRYLLSHTVAGRILTWQTRMESDGGLVYLRGKFQCREMIARRTNGILLEGDTQDDSQNTQRGAG